MVAEAVAGRVVGDREVGVAALARRLGHLLERVAPVGERRVAVQVAADVADLDQLRQLAVGRRGDLAVALAQLGLDVGEAEPLVDLLLGRVALDLAGLDLDDPVLGDREPLLDRPLAQLDVVLGRAGEVLEQVAVGVRGDDPQVDRDPVVGDDPGARRRPPIPACAASGCSVSASASAVGSAAVAIRSMSLQVSAQPPRRARDLDRVGRRDASRRAAASSSATGSTSESSRRSAGPLLAELARAPRGRSPRPSARAP